MSFVSDQGRDELLQQFTKFSGNKNYGELYKKLEKITICKPNGTTIIMGGFSIPDIGPSGDLYIFSDLLKENGWPEEDVMETKYMIKFFDGGDIENEMEALFVIEILILKNQEMKETLLKLKNDIITQNFENAVLYPVLLEEFTHFGTPLIFYSLWNFMTNYIK